MLLPLNHTSTSSLLALSTTPLPSEWTGRQWSHRPVDRSVGPGSAGSRPMAHFPSRALLRKHPRRSRVASDHGSPFIVLGGHALQTYIGRGAIRVLRGTHSCLRIDHQSLVVAAGGVVEGAVAGDQDELRATVAAEDLVDGRIISPVDG